MGNIIIGAVVFIITALAIYYSLKGKGSDCSSCNGHCHSGSCSVNKNDENSDLKGLL